MIKILIFIENKYNKNFINPLLIININSQEKIAKINFNIIKKRVQ